MVPDNGFYMALIDRDAPEPICEQVVAELRARIHRRWGAADEDVPACHGGAGACKGAHRMNPAGGPESPAARRPYRWEVPLKVQAARKLTDLGYPCGWEEWEVLGKYHGVDGLEYTQVRT